MPTQFTRKKYKDKLFHTEVNSIFDAINNLEAAININVGTSNAKIPSANIESLDANKIYGSATLVSLTANNLKVNEYTELNGQISFGTSGTLSLRNSEGIETIKMGLLELGEDNVYGFRVSDGINTNLLADEDGNVSVRGKIVALNDSEFTGKVNIVTGTVVDNLKVGNGVVLNGQTGEIIAGNSKITKNGINFTQGTITLQNLTIDEQGKLTATNVDLSGKFNITDGEIHLTKGDLGGVVINNDGLTAGIVDDNSPYFTLSKTGNVVINRGTFSGDFCIISGVVDGLLAINGSLVAPGVVFDHNGPAFANMTVNLNNGLLTIQNGRLTASQVDLAGTFKINAGEVLGTVNIGAIVLDGGNKKITAGTNELNETKFTFKSGSIDFGDNFKVSSTDGIIHAKNADIEGKFSGEVDIPTGSIGGFVISDTTLYSPAAENSHEYSMFVLDSQGRVTVFQDRASYGVGHKEDIVVDISQSGLVVNGGKISIRTAINGNKEVHIDNSGVRAIRSAQDEVIITGDGIKLKKDGEVSAPIISPDGFNAEFLTDGSLTSKKFLQVKPRPVSFVVGEGKLIQDSNGDYAELTLKWPIVTQRVDGEPADDIAGYRIYLLGGEYDTFQCVGVVGAEPDYPDAQPGSELYNLKVFKIKVNKNTSYGFGVIAFDKLGNESDITLGGAYAPEDTAKPDAPEFVHAYPGLYTVKVEWELSKAVDFKYFLVDKMRENGNWEPLPDTISNHFLDRNVEVGVQYKYRVCVVDRTGNKSDYAESQWVTPTRITSNDIEDRSISSNKLTEDLEIEGLITVGDGAILVPDEGVRMVEVEVSPGDEENPPIIEEQPQYFQIEYLRVLKANGDIENPIPKGIDVKNILIRDGEIILPEGVDTLSIRSEGEAPALRDLSVRNISVTLINNVNFSEFKAEFDQHLVNFGDYQIQIANQFDQLENNIATQFNSVNTAIANINSDIVVINNEIAQINLRLDGIDASISGINTSIGEINDEISQINLAIDDINASIGNIGGDIEDINNDLTQINTAISSIDLRVGDLETRADSVDVVLGNLETTIDSRFDTKIDPILTGINNSLDGKVDKIPGKGLSTEDFTTELKQKLESDDLTVANIYAKAPSEGTIGTAEAPFAALYADEIHTSGNTLWIGDTPVLGTDDTTIIIRSDPGQYIRITSDSGTELVATGLNSDVKIQATGAGGRVVMGSDTEVRMTSPLTVISGDLTVAGDLIVNGDSFIVNAETIEVEDNIIVLNKGQVGSGVSAGQAGIRVDRGDAPDYMIVFDEEEDMFKVGMLGNLETIASQNYVQSQLESVVKDADSLGGIPAEEFLNSRIVEEGSNENGEYIRWGNGLQVCWGLAMVPANESNSIVTMPAAFNGGFNITITNVYWNTPNITWSISSSVDSTVRVDPRTLGGASPTVNAYGRFIAIGRWK